MIAKLAYLTSPAPDLFLLNIQTEEGEFFRVEIMKAHLRNILITGTSLALQDSNHHRVPEKTKTESAYERAINRT